MEAAHKIMNLRNPDFFIIATGKSYSVEYFLSKCFKHLNLNYKKYLKVNKKLLRPTKTSNLVGDTKKAFQAFKFRPKTNLDDLIKIMMENELKKHN